MHRGTLADMPQEFRMPDIGEGLTEAEVITWFVDIGAPITLDQILVEVETAKTVVEIPSPFSGTITSILVQEGETVEVGEILFIVDGDPEASPQDPGIASPAATGLVDAVETTPEPTQPTKRPRIMPIIRKLANERGIDIASISGTGPGGAITRAGLDSAPTEPVHASNQRSLSQTRRAIADHMTESWRTIPHVTVQADVRAENLMRARLAVPDQPLPLECLLAEAVVPLLRTYTEFNSVYDSGSMTVRGSIDLGFAVDTQAGLIVVVVREADQLSTLELAAEFKRLAKAAQERTVALDDVTGQSFTISNIGALGGGHGTPIIPLGTSSIVSIGSATEQAVVEDGELAVGLVAPLDLSYDHRLIDGGLGQRFLSDLVANLETIG